MIKQRGLYINSVFAPIYNCLSIEYFKSDNDYPGAEGVFIFDPEFSKPDEYSIFVSPRYKSQSDLLTAFLLSHEISHAFRHSGKYHGLIKENLSPEEDCYKDEALAFTSQFLFLAGLNKGEQETLLALAGSESNYARNSKEVTFLRNYLMLVGTELGRCFDNKVSGDDYPFECIADIFLKQVKADKYYQRQCAN